MRLAVFHNQPSGGARRALHGFCRELSSRHEVDVYTLESSDRSLPDQVSGRVLRLPYAPRPAIRGGLYLNDLRRSWDLRDLEAVNRTAAELIDGSAVSTPAAHYLRAGAPALAPSLRGES